MPRILLILLLAILLLSAPPSEKERAVVAGRLLVNAKPLMLDSRDPAQRQAGTLTFLEGWELASTNKDFGGISSIRATRDGGILALSDSGTLMGFNAAKPDRRKFIAPLPIRTAERDWPNWKWDSEAMIHDPVSDRSWVSFELINRICRYAPGFARVEACRTWPAMEAWPETGGAEAMARLPDGRFLMFSEFGYGADGGNDVLLFSEDPTETSTVPPVHLSYRAPQGYRPTDALWIGHNRLLVLNRRVTVSELFTGVIALVTLPPLRPGAVLVAKPIARLVPPLLADNFEAMALSHERGQPVLWIASDDNHLFFQRSLLLKFALPPELFDSVP